MRVQVPDMAAAVKGWGLVLKCIEGGVTVTLTFPQNLSFFRINSFCFLRFQRLDSGEERITGIDADRDSDSFFDSEPENSVDTV